MTHTVVNLYQLMAPAFDEEPHNTSLANTDQFYLDHRPALVQLVYTVDAGITRQFRWEGPIPSPAADGIDYRFVHIVEQTGGAGTLTVKVEEYDSGWNTLENTTGIAFSGMTTHAHTDTISASSTALRVTYSTSDGVTTYTPQSVLVRPGETTVPTGVLASGHREYESTLVTTAGAPINTEMLDRHSNNVRAVVADRQQCVLSFGQDDSAANIRYDTTNAFKAAGEWLVCGISVAQMPYARNGDTVTFEALASVDAGATADLVRVRQIGAGAIGGAATVNADGVYNSGSIAVNPDKAGTLEASVTFEIAIKFTTGQIAYLHSMLGHWIPTLPDAPWTVASGVSPAATVELLVAAVKAVEEWAFRPWAQPALCFDGAGAGGGPSQRRFTASVGLGVNHARARITRCHPPGPAGASQSATVIGTSSSGGYSGASLITLPVVTFGAEGYFDLDGSFWAVTIQTSGELVDDTPATSVDRQIELTEDKAPSDETIDVQYAAGFGLAVTRLTQDRESL